MKQVITTSDLELGRMIPQATDLEEAVLGALMLEYDCYPEVSNKLHAGLFYKDSNCTIYEAIKSLAKKKSVIDILTVTNELRSMNALERIGGAYYISNLTGKLASSSNVQWHIAILQEKFIRRRLINLSLEACAAAYEEATEIETLITNATKTADLLNSYLLDNEIEDDMAQSIQETLDYYSAPRKTEYPGLITGSTLLNKAFGGWTNGELYILAARLSMGKTARMIQYATRLAEDGIPVAIFSLEMKKLHSLNLRLISYYSGVDADAIKSQEFIHNESMNQRVQAATAKIKRLPIYIYDKSSLTPNQLKAKMRYLVRKCGVKMGFVDYLQLMTPNDVVKGRNREGDIASISRGLKNIALDLNIPIMALSQLSRAIENRKGNDLRPQLSDLRESGSIEQDADGIIALHSPSFYIPYGENSYYGKDYSEAQYGMITEMYVLKNKNGKRNQVFLEFFDKEHSRFLFECPGNPEAEQTDLPF